MYKKIIRPILFRFNAERVHEWTLGALKLAGKIPVLRGLLRATFTISDPRLEREVLGMTFPNPVGMAAGFDKDARVYRELGMLGLGFVEVGTLTPLPQPGNPKPRLFRLPKDRAIINRMGFNNRGMETAAENLRARDKKERDKKERKKPIVGINIGKNTLTPNEQAPADYLKLFRRLYELGDYFVVNVSCPNVAGLTKLQTTEYLLSVVEPLLEFRQGQDTYKPILIKISPDLTREETDAALKVVTDTLVDGVVATNTTTSREGLHISHKKLNAIGKGGLSGGPLTARALDTVKYAREKIGPTYPIIATGGVMTTTDAVAMLDAGADLVQIYTGMIYNGPGFARKICKAILTEK